ncbi:MAG: hypothetical protein JW825_04070, partial [Candidatus Methanofastidiosa archaeon]|nr:hypothetical protein [Candidatus Methanofastidiosa archaeon]
MYKDYKLVLCSSLILLLVLGSLPLAGAEEDFDYSLSYELGSSVVEQGGELAVTVTLIGRYVSSEPYDLDRQVEAIVEILFDGSAIGEATIPAGPMKLIPYQDITISETVPGLVPLDASPGTHDIIVRCYLSALGYEVEERKAFTIDVIQAVEGALPEAPKIYLSLSPSQTCIGGTSTLTV